MSGYFFPPPPPPPPVHPQPPQTPQNAQYPHRGGASSGYGRGRGNRHGNGNAPYSQGAYQNPGYQNARGNYQGGGFSRGQHAYSGQGHANHIPNYPKHPHQPSWPVAQQHGANPGFNQWMGPGTANAHAFQHSSLPPYAPNMSQHQHAYPAPVPFPNQPQYPMPAVANQTITAPPLRLGFSDGSNSIVELTPPQNTFASHANKKRKRDNENFQSFRRGPGSSGPPHQRQRNQNTARIQASPPVPTFGFAEAPVNPARQPRNNPKKKNKKRNPNSLGLTPSGHIHEPSDEEVDEEEAFRASGNR
jgi:hypothetical protein